MKRYRIRSVLVLNLVVALALAASGAAGGEDDEAKDAARRQVMLAAGRAALCRVHYYFKRPEDEVAPDRDRWYMMDSMTRFRYEGLINRQMSLLTVGLLLDDAGHVLAGDMHVEDKYIDRIEIVAPDGTRYPAEREKLLDRAAAVVLSITKPLQNWEPPAFVKQERIEDPKSAYVVFLKHVGREWWVAGGRVGALYPYEGTGSEPGRLVGAPGMGPSSAMALGGYFDDFSMHELMGTGNGGPSRAPALLCNADGQPVGAVVMGWPFEPDQIVTDWQHERLLDGPALGFGDLKDLVEQGQQDFGKAIYECKILYRQEGDEDSPMGLMSRLERYMMSGMGDEEKEWETYGLAVGPQRLLVPQPIGREQAAMIEKIEVKINDKPCAAEFAGAFRDVGAFLVDLKSDMLPAVASVSAHERPDRMRLFLTVEARKKLGKEDLLVRPNRWFAETRGYKDLYYISPVHTVSSGAWILNRDFDVVGVYARQRIEAEELHGFGDGGMGRYMMGDMSRGNARIFWSAEVAEMLADPVAHFDKHIRFKTKEEAKRTVWLGVEFSPVSAELAKQLDIEKETKDGTIGLYVNRVYKGSPAERMAIKQGDVLLRIETRKLPHPIDLNPGWSPFDYFDWDWDWTDYMDYEYMEEYSDTQPRWPLRLNYFTMLLKAIGEGEKVKLTYLQDGQEVTKEFAVEQAPRDFLSAKKYKNKEIGFTVKDLTYEVRAALRLSDDKAAVVVSKVEPGSPVQVAKINPFELITELDREAVSSVEEFEKRIEEALKAGKQTVRLKVEYLGKSRLADLDLSEVEATESD